MGYLVNITEKRISRQASTYRYYVVVVRDREYTAGNRRSIKECVDLLGDRIGYVVDSRNNEILYTNIQQC